MADKPEKLDSIARHRRQTCLGIFLPVLSIGLLLLLLALSLAVPGSPLYLTQTGQFSIISNIFLICFVLCPLVICAFPIYLLLALGAFLLNKVDHSAADGLRRVQTISRSAADRATTLGDRLSRSSIRWNARFAFVDRWLRAFEPRQNGREDETIHDERP
jgi:TM2 domain-containing membrane protein YozV